MDLITCAFICLFLCVKALNIVPYASYSPVLDYETNKRHRGAFVLSTSSELDRSVNAIYCSRLCEQAYDCLGINVCMESGVTSCNLVPYSLKPLNIGKLGKRKGCSFFHKVCDVFFINKYICFYFPEFKQYYDLKYKYILKDSNDL